MTILTITFVAGLIWSTANSPLAAQTPPTHAFQTAANTGKILFYSFRDGNDEIYVMDSDGTNQTRLTNNIATDKTPIWSPDGTKIAFVSRRNGGWGIWTMNPDGSSPVLVFSDFAEKYPEGWSPDGKTISFASSQSGNAEIYTINVDGTGIVRLTNDPAQDSCGDWSPDGQRLVFFSNRSTGRGIYTMKPDGSDVQKLAGAVGVPEWCPTWSPDGGTVAYPSGGEIYTIHADGSNLLRLTTNATSDFAPDWSPDGTMILFTSGRDGNNEIYIMNADGSNPIRLTNNPANDDHAVWQPTRSQSCETSPATGLNSCSLEPGDILLVRGTGNNLFGAATTTLIKSGSYFHHAGLYVGGQEITEATGFACAPGLPCDRSGEVITHPLSESVWWDTNTTIQDWVVLRPKLPLDKALVVQVAKDWAKADNPIIGYAFSGRDDDTSFYCSKLAWRAYDLVSYDIERPRWEVWGFTPDPLITPGDLYNDRSDVVQKDQHPKDTRPVLVVISKPAQASTTQLSPTLAATGPAHLMLVDPQGRRTGFDPNTGTILNEIPDAIYSGTDAVYENVSVPNFTDNWQVIVTGTDTSNYRLVADFIDAVNPQQQVFEGNTTPGKVNTFTISSPKNTIYIPLTYR